MRIIKFVFTFLVGACGYGLIEMAWRGKTHPTMLLAGGICFSLISVTVRRMAGYSFLATASVCALLITLLELALGIELNLTLRLGIWDYSGIPYNLAGQICPTYSIYWFGLSVLVIPIAKYFNGITDKYSRRGVRL